MKQISEDLDDTNYLGSPAVVHYLLEEYVEDIFEGIKARGNGSLAAADFTALMRSRGIELANIFMGRNPAYVPLKGWNSPYRLGIAIKQSLGEFWNLYGKEYNNDPCQALFGWIAASLVDTAKLAIDDADLAGVLMQEKLQQVSRLLLRTHKRR